MEGFWENLALPTSTNYNQVKCILKYVFMLWDHSLYSIIMSNITIIFTEIKIVWKRLRSWCEAKLVCSILSKM